MMTDKKPLTISCVVFEFPKGTTLSDVIKDLQYEEDVHFDDKLVANMRIEFSTVSEEEYYERSPMR
jgi:hypothetical protein